MAAVSRKPVPSLSIATGSPKLQDVPEGSESWAKEVEKGEVKEETKRVSTEIDLDPPVPAYKRVVTGFGDLGDNFAFAKVRSWKPTTKNAGNRLSVQSKRLSQRFGQEIAGEKRYLGLSRRSFMLSLIAFVIIVLAVAIGLGVGLKRIHRYGSGSTQLQPY
jgi:hypothetical protein